MVPVSQALVAVTIIKDWVSLTALGGTSENSTSQDTCLAVCVTGITDLGCLGECIGLERLDLSKNDITKLHKLAGLSALQSLNLSANRISSLGWCT